METGESLPAVYSQITPDGQRLPGLNEQQQKAREFYESGLYGAPNSKKAYQSDVKQYLAWYHHKGYEALPSTSQALAEYMTELSTDKGYFTLQRRLASIAKYHRIHNLPSPTTHEQFKLFMKGVRREKTIRQKQALAFTLDEFRKAVDSQPLTPTGLRNRLILLLGFTGAFRRQELVDINVENLECRSDGILITINHSKTNQDGVEEAKFVAKAKQEAYCPLRTLQQWLTLINRAKGPLFVRIRKRERPTLDRLSDDYVNLLTKAAFGQYYSAHSMRASFVTISKDAGVDNRKIQNQTKHKTTQMIDRYDRRRDVIYQNASTELDL